MTNSVIPKFDMSFDDWIKFIYDHPVSDDIKSAWYWDDDLSKFWDQWEIEEGSAERQERQLEYATRLFQDCSFLLAEYDPTQINQGFWFLLSRVPGFGLADLIWK